MIHLGHLASFDTESCAETKRLMIFNQLQPSRSDVSSCSLGQVGRENQEHTQAIKR